MNTAELYSDASFKPIAERVLRRGLDLHQYKASFVGRRLEVRLRARGVDNYQKYAAILDEDPSEYAVLFDALSINVTEFFRDEAVFDAFSRFIVPEMLARSNEVDLRIWSAGCASGEEAYTIAIALTEALKRLGSAATFTVLGTDVSKRAIEVAKLAKYPFSSLRKLPERVVSEYFRPSPEEGYYEVGRKVRDSMRFSSGDLVLATRPTNVDVIFCRNVLIYMGREVQAKLFTRFYRALNASGYLVLGMTETIIGAPAGVFEARMQRERIFQKR
ncbi:MAG TPA: protein-glutamate O-methyltransferase CheR [Nitrososphaerales archaeon]|nr:protein-glutamate O-methyltransferase CheR [Nitrososphaerales archaeon]